MKKIGIYILLLSGLIASCGNWLDVQPHDQVSEEQLYSKAQGFYNQLNGLYRNMASPELYGKELSWGFMDVLAQYYDMSNYSPWKDKTYREVSQLNYDYERVKPYFSTYWEKMYNMIANCNNLIQNVSVADSSLFPLSERERRCIEGEARALRGFLHFDLLRMYTPAMAVDSVGKYIPYVDYFPTHITTKMESNKLMDKISEDLLRGHELTMDFDTSYKRLIYILYNRLELTGTGIDRFMDHRGYRLNHYAIKALLARVNLWRGNKKEALKWASEIMDLVRNGWFRFTSESDIKNDENMKLYGDVLFALYNNNLTLYESQANDGKQQLVAWDYNTLFDTDANRDYRRHQWEYDENEDYWKSVKYKEQSDKYITGRISNLMIPVLRCSEMCYIIAECSYAEDKAYAESYLSYIRQSRGCRTQLESSSTQEEFNQLILKDFRREFYGEGQLFYFYKRLGLEGIRDSRTTVKYDSKFVFPVPESDDI